MDEIQRIHDIFKSSCEFSRYKQSLYAWHIWQQQHPADHLFVISRVTHVVSTALDKTINWITLVLFILTRGELGSIFLVGSTFICIRTRFEEDVFCFGIVCEWNLSFYAHIVSKFTIFPCCLAETVLPWGARNAFVTLLWSETWKSNKQIRDSKLARKILIRMRTTVVYLRRPWKPRNQNITFSLNSSRILPIYLPTLHLPLGPHELNKKNSNRMSSGVAANMETSY